MEYLKLKDLNLSLEESRYIIEFLARKRNVNNYKRKSNDESLHALKESEKQNKKSKNNQQQQIKTKNKERIEVIREQFKELAYRFSKSELKEIKRHLYMVENKKGLLGSKKTKKYLDELDKKIRKLDKYYHHDDFEFRGIRNIQDLFKSSIDEDYYKPTLVKSGYNSNYIQYESKGDKILTGKEYLGLIEPYLANMINDYKSKGEWKIQLTAEINFTSLKPDSDETRFLHTKSDNTEIMIGRDTNEVIKELFKSFLQRYQEGLQEKMRGSDFEFDGIHLLYYDFNKISLNRSGSYLESGKWIKDKKSTINPKNNDYKCVQYAVTVALNRDKIKKDSKRASKIKPFIDQYNWNDIDFPSTGKDWKNIELNIESIALNILYVPHKTGKMHLAYKSKHNLTREKQVILLMITDGEKWHYTAVTGLSRLLRIVTGNNNGDFYCLNCFHAYRTKTKLETHKKICENHDYCHVEMPNEDNKVIKYNQGEKSIKSPFIM